MMVGRLSGELHTARWVDTAALVLISNDFRRTAALGKPFFFALLQSAARWAEESATFGSLLFAVPALPAIPVALQSSRPRDPRTSRH